MKIRLKKTYEAIIYTGENDNDVREYLGYPRLSDLHQKSLAGIIFIPPIGSAIFFDDEDICWARPEEFEEIL